MKFSLPASATVLASAVSLFAPVAFAQNAATATSGTNSATVTTTVGTPAPVPVYTPPRVLAPTDPDRLLDREGAHWGLGVRAWVFITPPAFVRLFSFVAPGWPGGVNPAIGPELTYRNGSFEADFSVMYVGYNAPTAVFHGLDEGDNAAELVTSSLYAIYGTATLMYGIRLDKFFEVQIGAGFGLGGVGGDLRRSQAFPDSGPGSVNGFGDCQEPGGAAGSQRSTFCGSENNHYSHAGAAAGTPAYTEPSWFDHPAGSRPVLLPWISIPHIALHVQPTAHFDLKVEGGFAFTGLYAGGSLHYLF